MKKRIGAVLLLAIGLFTSAYAAAETRSFLAVEEKNGDVIRQEGDLSKRFPPFSTFKIAISLMGYDSGILIDEITPTWEYKPGYVDWLERWKQPHNPTLWLANSNVWYSQIITRRLGMSRFKGYVEKLKYGNEDVSGDVGKHNGLTNSWLSSSLAISPLEQVEFLRKLIRKQLPVSAKAQEFTKKIMFVEELQNGWKLYGKTGNGSQLSRDRRTKLEKQAGWFVGFATRESRTIVFAYLIADDKKRKTYASLRAKAALKEELKAILSKM